MAKDVNIKVKTEGGQQVKQELIEISDTIELMNKSDSARQAVQDQKDFQEHLAKTADAAKETQDALDQAGKAGEEAMEKPAAKAGFLELVLMKAKAQVIGFIVAWAGIKGIAKLFEMIIEKMQKVLDLQKEISEQSLKLAEIGQTLEAKTGTVGQQQGWVKEALGLQAAGGLGSPDIAAALMINAQESFKDVGGIRNPDVRAMLYRLAPKLGAAAISESDLDRIFDDEVNLMGDVWESQERARDKHEHNYVKGPKPKFGVSPDRFESLLIEKFGVSDAQVRAYLESPLGTSSASQAGDLLKDEGIARFTMDWSQRMEEAGEEHKRLVMTGKDRWIRDKVEPTAMALESLHGEIQGRLENARSPQEREALAQLERDARWAEGDAEGSMGYLPGAPSVLGKRGATLSQRLQQINNHYDYSMHFHPKVGEDPYQERVSPP